MRYEALFREWLGGCAAEPERVDRAVARVRRAERCLGGCLDDWWEARPPAELPAELRPDGSARRRGAFGGFRDYTGFREELEDAMDPGRWSIGFTDENLWKGLRASAKALEPGLRLQDGDVGAPLGLLGRGRDGAVVVAHLVKGEADDADLARLAGRVAMAEAGALEGIGSAGSMAPRGYLVAAGFENGVLELVARTAGVAAKVYVPTMAFMDAPRPKPARWSRTRRRR